MALSLVSPVISFVAQKAGNSMIEEFCKMFGMEKNRKKLHRQLLAIQAVIGNAEERGTNEPHVLAWLEELKAAAYKAEDVLDEFQYEAFRRQVQNQEPSSSIKKVTESLNLHGNSIVFRYKIGKNLAKVLEKINEIISEMNTFSFIPHNPQQVISRPPTHSYVMESEVIGRDGEKEEIMNMLLDPNREMAENVSILPIVGMGGVGKTTLAQLVYSEKKIQDHFNLKMWVCVSNDFNVVNIVKSIIEVATNGQCVSTSNLEVLQNHLREIFGGKKYLLVLDDIWNEKMQKWDDLKPLLMCGVCSGSVIVVTTRNKNVAEMMATLPIHDLVMLSEKDSWNLFRKRAFHEVEETEQFVGIGRKIVVKCRGLPLALKTVGGLMRTKQKVSEWRFISENKIWENESSNNGILPALKLSYDQLPCYMKQCFTFCAMFPEDYEFDKETLINLWMANGFIPNEELNNVEDKGGYIFYELCWRSFFQDVNERQSDYGEVHVQCKMHDLMHDLAKHIAGKQCANSLEVGSDQVLHLLAECDPSLDNLNSVLKKFPVVQTCLIRIRFEKESENKKGTDSVKHISLRALKMHTDQLPKELGYMKHLRYLDVSYGRFGLLPESICTLYNLLTLDLSHSSIRKLPEGMRYMISLENLILVGCYSLMKMSIHLGKLKNLRTISKYMIDRDPGCSIEELQNLNLHGCLILSGLENVRDEIEAEAANMIAKTKLYHLKLHWGSPVNEERTRNDSEVLEGLKPHNELTHLFIYGYAGCEFATWMKDTSVIRHLRKLDLSDCINCTTLPPIWQLPLLEHLELNKMRSLVYICNTGDIQAEDSEQLKIFPNLKVLEICYLDNLEGWHELDHKLVEFPKLEKLRIHSCPKLKSIPSTSPLSNFYTTNPGRITLVQISNMTMGVSSELNITLYPSPTEPDAFRPPKNVEKMKVHGLENVVPLEEDNEENCQEPTLRRLIVRNSNCFFSCGTSQLSLGFWKYLAFLETLYIDSCSALSVWPEEEFRSLKCLKELRIEDCENLTYSSQESLLTEKYGEELLPGLETLIITHCPKLVEIPNCSKSLKVLYVEGCSSLTKEGLNLLKNLYELTELLVYSCENLNSLPDALEHLISLKHLMIDNCPAMESFPEGLQQWLPALQYLRITKCPVLEKHCQNGGDYQHLVTAIPRKFFSSDIEREYCT